MIQLLSSGARQRISMMRNSGRERAKRPSFANALTSSGPGALGSDDFFEDVVEGAGDFPIGVVRLEFAQVGDVADVIAFAGLLDVAPVQLLAGHPLDAGDGF